MDRFFSLLLSIIFFTVLTLFFNGNVFGKPMNSCNYIKDRHVNNTTLIAACPDCELCGKDVEIMGDRHLKSGDRSFAIKSYVKAVKVYKQELLTNPNNKSIKSGLNRTENKLKNIVSNK